MSGGSPKRSVRVAEEIRGVIMELLLRGEVHDPGAASVTVTDVKLSDDLRHARVYVRTFDHECSVAEQQNVVRSMTRAAGVMRRAVGARIRSKYTPDLRFYWDDTLDDGLRVEGVLEELRRTRAGQNEDG